MNYRPEIDGLRAIAVVSIILYHSGFKLFAGGFVGVDVFFVISGYLITTIILGKLETGHFSIIYFYERRARRILPALFTVLLACIPFAWFWMLPNAMKEFSESLIAVSTFTSNVLFWQTSGYFDSATELKPLIHTWSLAVEVQYYLFFPIFIMLSWKLSKCNILKLLLLVFFISLGCAQWLSLTHPSFNFYMLPTRGWELLIGSFIAFYYLRYDKKKHNQYIEQLGSLLGLSLITFTIFFYSDKTPFPSIYALVPTLGSALIIIFSSPNTLVGKLLRSRLFVFMGLISYSAYLWHQPLLAYSRIYTFNQNSSLLNLTLLLTTFFLSILSYYFIERPFRDSHRCSQKIILILSLSCLSLFLIIGINVYKNNGVHSSHNVQVIQINNAVNDWIYPGQLEKSKINGLYVYDKSKPIDILFFGDSHAQQFATLAEELMYKRGKNIGFLSDRGCPPIPNLMYYTDRLCFDLFNQLDDVLNIEKNIKTIVIAGCFNCYLIENKKSKNSKLYFFDGKKRLDLSEGKGINESLKSFQSFINRLAMNKDIIVIGDVPNNDNFDPFVIASSIFSKNSTFFSKKYIDFKTYKFSPTPEESSLNIKIKSLVGSNARFINSQEIVCPENECSSLEITGEPKFKDSNHMRPFYARLMFTDLFLNLFGYK